MGAKRYTNKEGLVREYKYIYIYIYIYIYKVITSFTRLHVNIYEKPKFYKTPTLRL